MSMNRNLDAIKNHQAPKSSGVFFKLKDGESAKIRLVSDCYMYMDSYQGGKPSARYAFVMWNFTEERAQILQASVTVFETIQSFVADEEWGDYGEYDLKIRREGTGKDTKYPITPSPINRGPVEKVLSAEQLEELEKLDLYGLMKLSQDELVPLSEANNGKEVALSDSDSDDEVGGRQRDNIPTDVPDGPVNLDDIPF